MIYTASIHTPLGEMTASAEGGALTGLWFVNQKYYPANREAWAFDPAQSVFSELDRWLKDYFAGKSGMKLPRLAPKGTAFQMAVWDMLLAIPYGGVTTYGVLARKLAAAKGISSMSAQAVGGAVGHNPISILIPCHRVVSANGSLTGYAGGVERKRALLRMENAELTGVKA